MNTGFVNAVEMLPLPRAAGLDAAQLGGTRCVWCTRSPELGLGPRISVIGGALKRWEPRACRPCAGRAAQRVYGLHVRTCARCVHRDYCPDSRALHALSLQG